MNLNLKCFFLLLAVSGILRPGEGAIKAQPTVRIHSHNDYRQTVPFHQAWAQGIYSIEVDLFIHPDQNQLKVAHDREEVLNAPTFDSLYLAPVVELYKQGKIAREAMRPLQLLIDLKTSSETTLPLLTEKLNAYPEIFNHEVNPHAVKIVISGNTPQPKEFGRYPAFILFDASPEQEYTPEELKRVGMMSTSFRSYSKWNGKGGIIAAEKSALERVIRKAHENGKEIRFWGTPDGITAWNTFYNLGIDIINTDRVERCSDFFNRFDTKRFAIESLPEDSVTETTRIELLDKTTRNFSGFKKNEQTLSERIPIYTPTYLNDGEESRVKNVILLIGDGMGLSQICATQTVNKQLSFLQLRHIGLQQTHAKDEYTTDSAGAGSALATGQASNNRHISMSAEGEIHPTLPELLAPQGIACGVITSGNIADATPAAFYGHSTERDDSDAITAFLLNGKLSLLAGSGMEVFTNRKDSVDLLTKLAAKYNLSHQLEEIDAASSRKLLCIDERFGDAASSHNLTLLAEATKRGLKKLTADSPAGLFLMVEAAKIDYAGHANSMPATILETLSFDLAVSEALRFADSNGETLVIVTGDHETGGLVLLDGNSEQGSVLGQFVTNDHTPVMLPVFAYGPGAQLFRGVYPNTQIFHHINSLLNKKSR